MAYDQFCRCSTIVINVMVLGEGFCLYRCTDRGALNVNTWASVDNDREAPLKLRSACSSHQNTSETIQLVILKL